MLTSSRSLDCFALMKPSFYHLSSRFSVTLELHYALKALKHVWPKSTLRFCSLTGESFFIPFVCISRARGPLNPFRLACPKNLERSSELQIGSKGSLRLFQFITKARDILSLRFWKCDRVEASPRGDFRHFLCIYQFHF